MKHPEVQNSNKKSLGLVDAFFWFTPIILISFGWGSIFVYNFLCPHLAPSLLSGPLTEVDNIRSVILGLIQFALGVIWIVYDLKWLDRSSTTLKQLKNNLRADIFWIFFLTALPFTIWIAGLGLKWWLIPPLAVVLIDSTMSVSVALNNAEQKSREIPMKIVR